MNVHARSGDWKTENITISKRRSRMITKVNFCLECGKKIESETPHNLYCSDKCQQRFYRKSYRGKQNRREYEQRPEIKERIRGYRKKAYQKRKEKEGIRNEPRRR
jgi:predicted nucleic acid-binding Zn ribbon protein